MTDASSPASAASPAESTLRVGILLFDEVEVLDACGPFEVFSVAARVAARLDPGAPVPFEVVLVSAASDTSAVTARGGLRLLPDAGIDTAPDLDLLVVPGGVTGAVEKNTAVLDWIAAQSMSATLASVCTGAFILAEAGILTTQTVTTHWEDQAELAERFPALTVTTGTRWVHNDGIFTSAGISAGLDLSLHLVEVLVSAELAVATARQMDYAWAPEEVALPLP